MGFYNYPIAHSYISRAYAGGGFLDLLGVDPGKSGADAAAGAKAQLLNDPAIDTKVKTLTQEAVDSGIERAKQNIFGSISGGFGAIQPYLPFIVGGVIGLVVLFYFL